ncbi:MAG: hypothetical protein V1734_03075 [Nanoarchaeota archaeon]
METKTLTDIVLNSVKGSNYANTEAADDYFRIIDNYYKLSPETPEFARTSYLRSIHNTLVSLNDINVEGMINPKFLGSVNYTQKASGIGSLLIAALPVNPFIGALGFGCLSVFIGIIIAKFRAKKYVHLKDLQEVADELAPVRDELKKVELKDLDYVLQQSKEEIMPYLRKAI